MSRIVLLVSWHQIVQPWEPISYMPAVAAQWPSILNSLSRASIGHNRFDALLLAQPFHPVDRYRRDGLQSTVSVIHRRGVD
jgi:hypothetical protein